LGLNAIAPSQQLISHHSINSITCVISLALRSQPIDAAASVQPIINISLAFEAFDVPNFDSGVVGLNLPVVRRYSHHFKDNPGRFAHACQYAPDGSGSLEWLSLNVLNHDAVVSREPQKLPPLAASFVERQD
jgi:hypothetical protein